MSWKLKTALRTLSGFVIVLGFGYGFGVSSAQATNAQPSAAFEETECPFPAAPNQFCGFVTVPEDRANADSPEIRLAVIITEGDADAAPVVMLSGGPGEITTVSGDALAPIAQNIVGGRTLIQFDQRGVGRSEPALACPEWVETQLTMLETNPDPAEALRLNNEALLACADRLASEEGINLSAYNSVENAADVADLIRALGYEQADLFGVSYGSLLAQHVMRDHADVVRSVIIDSVLPLGTSFNLTVIDSATAAIDRLVGACAADAACNTAFPDLRRTLFDAIDFYNANPVPITVTDPMTGETYDTFLYGDSILGTLFFFLYQTPAIPTLPQAIVAMADGDLSVAESLQSQQLVALYTLERGMQYSVFCAEDVKGIGITEVELLERYSALPPQYRGRVDLEDLLENSSVDLCAQWPVAALAAEFIEPIASEIPTLALAGEFDPVTPPGFAQEVAANLPNSFTYTFPGVGHSVALASECAAGIIQQFLDNPTTEPNAECIDDMGLTFQIPGAALELETVISDMFGFVSVIPAGWQEIAPGLYAQSAISSTAIIQQSAPFSAGELLALLAGQFGIDAFPEASGTVEANSGLTWTLYETTGPQGLLADVALTEADGTTYLIVLLVDDLNRPAYYDGLFLPAVNALTPQN